MAIKLSLKKHLLLNISFTTDIVFLLKSDKTPHASSNHAKRVSSNAGEHIEQKIVYSNAITLARRVGIPTCIRGKIRGCTIIRTRVGGTYSHTRRRTHICAYSKIEFTYQAHAHRNVLPELASISCLSDRYAGSFSFSFALSSTLVL